MNHFLRVRGSLGVLLPAMTLLALGASQRKKGRNVSIYVLEGSGGRLTSQLLAEHGDRPKISSCLNTQPAHRALTKFTISQNKHVSAQVSGVVPILTP